MAGTISSAADFDWKTAFNGKRYHGYGSYLKEKFGSKVFKVIVDAGFTCPNRDGSKGYGGCAYCNVDSFTPRENRQTPSVHQQVIEGIERAKKNYGAEKFIVYFQPNTNTYAPVEELRRTYREAVDAAPDEILGLTIGTRPDCVNRAIFDTIHEEFGNRYVSIEYGMESVNDETLASINRGNTHADFVDAVNLANEYAFDICAHVIFGLPGDSEEDWLRMGDELNRLPIRFAKLHHLHVVKGSILAKRYRENPFPLFNLESYSDFLSKLLPQLRPDLVIQRLFGIADLEMLIAPNWDLKKTLIQRHIERSFEQNGIWQGQAYVASLPAH